MFVPVENGNGGQHLGPTRSADASQRNIDHQGAETEEEEALQESE
jgi:hypothetical protein